MAQTLAQLIKGVSLASAPAGSLTVDSSGRLFVGTSSARTNAPGGTEGFLIEGTSSTNSQNRFTQHVFGSSSTDGPYLGLAKTRSTSIGGNTVVQSGDELGGIYFQGADGSDFKQGASILSYVDGTPGANDMPGRLVFSTTADGASSPTERMRISADGQVRIEKSGDHLYLKQSSGAFGWVQSADQGDGSFRVFRFDSGNTERLKITSGGTIYSLATYNNTAAASANMHVDSNGIFYRATSSAKYKTDIETLEDQYADALLNVRPVWYRSTTGNEPADWSWYGFIAEEVAEIDPRLVHWKTVEGVLDEQGRIEYTELEAPIAEGVQYERFVPHLLNLIKRQKEQIEAQGTAIAALEARLTTLESA